MSVDIKLDGNHDLAVKNGQLVLLSGVNLVAQQIKIALKTFLGEWFVDNSLGVPYFDYVLVKQADKVKIENIFRKHILAVRGVNRVLKLNTEIDRKERLLIVSFKVETSEGTVMDKLAVGG